MKLKDLKIGTQMKIGFGIIVLLIAVLGTISWHQTNKIAKHTSDIYNHPFTVRKALGKLNADILEMRLEFRNFMLADDNQGRQTAITNSDFYQADAERQFEIMRERYLGPPTDIENAQKAFVRWVSVRKSNRELGQTGKISEAMSRIEDTGVIGKEREYLLECIRTIDDSASKKATQYILGTVVLENFLHRQLSFLVAGILTLTILITYLLNRNIRRPVAELANVTKLFREGKTDARSSYKSLNEFGQLSTSFNNLADTIETELTLNTQAAKIAGAMLSEDDAHRFCHALLATLLEHTGSQMGAVYLLNDGKTGFNHFECLGMDLDECKPFSAVHFEGEFGTALASQKMQHITAIPDDTRFTFSTVSGKYKPREIITIPIVSGNETVAVISLATIKSFSNNSLRLLNTVLSMLSARMDGILAYRKVIAFSHQLENQNSELEAQKRELSAQANVLTGQNVELEIQKKQLDEANRMKTSFLANMSHELRTPLNSVIALSGVLNRRLANKIPEEEYSYLDIIERNGKQLLSLINDILDLSRIEAGHEEIEIRKFNISELIREVVEMIEPQANLKNISLQYLAGENLPEIRSDYDKCRHILQNLVANAVKFTEEGGVKITVESKAKDINIAIIDTGIGIDNEHLPHIFDEFRQADGSNSRKYSGTGLGLAIAKKYAYLLGGSIEVDSIRGKGSKFTINLPLQIENQQVVVETPPAKYQKTTVNAGQYIGQVNTKQKTILLVVEDNHDNMLTIKALLDGKFTVIEAEDEQMGIEMAQLHQPHLILMDIALPGLNGIEVLNELRKGKSTEHIPVIAVSASAMKGDREDFIALGFDGYISKPIDNKMFEKTIREFLG